ncbi:MAG TPA: hypothetical protein VGE10_09810 [Zeimonas sp.]
MRAHAGARPARRAGLRRWRPGCQKAWKQAQLALNEGLGVERVVALHALLDDRMQRLEEQEPAQR